MYQIVTRSLAKQGTAFRLRYSLSTQANKPGILHILKTYGKELQLSGVYETMIPRAFTEENLASITVNQRFTKQNNHLNSLNYSLSEPIWDLLDRGGKRWRPVLAMLIAELYGKPRQQVFELAALTEIVHNGSLIIDDIEDNSSIRRDKQCVHRLFGLDISINAGNFMYYSPMLTIFNSSHYSTALKNELVRIYLQQVVQLHIGQAWDIAWHNIDKLKGEYPSENQYLQMTAQKTAVLARLAARMTCAYANAPADHRQFLCRFVENLGVAFQIQDDIINLESEEFKKTKGYNGEDIHEGKITLMVIHHLKNGSQQSIARLIQILKMKTQDQKLIAEAITLLNQTSSIDYAKKIMYELVDQANRELDQHFPLSQSRELLKELADLGVKRNK